MKKIIIGPPGTGKTTIATKIAYERCQKLGNKVGYFAFTKRAAREATGKMKLWLNGEGERLNYFRTLHSLCFLQSGIRRDRVFDIDGFAGYAGLHCTKKKYDPDENDFYLGPTEDDKIIFQIGLLKAKGINSEHKKLKAIWDLMDRYKKIRGLWDFHDMLIRFAENGPFPKLHTIILDEAQDLTPIQRQTFNILCANNPEALIIEALDADQAIFNWAGSEVDLEKLCDNADDVQILGQSFRVPAPIHALATKVIEQCRKRKEVNWAPAKHEGAVKHIMYMEDVPKEHLTNILILVRNYCYAIPYMRWFKDHDLAFGPLKDDKKHPIRIGTIHESKGAEADNVVLDLNMTRKSWDVLPTDEEKRVWYTGITRAKRNLYLMMPRARCNAENLLA